MSNTYLNTDARGLAERNRQVALRFLDGTHSPNLVRIDVIDETVAPNVVCHGFPGGDPFDHESYKRFFRIFQSSFSEMEFALDALIADDRYVSARWSISCKFTGAFAGIEPTGQTVDFNGMVLYRLEDGLIVETWLHIDELSLLGQIGALPQAA
ncbi:ester cyclase [Devosia nitrariae]|uniref:Ester cyclase n=1 Tax=Devosia nitrariae TaxID=2071872 RepID=A0ABQ5W5L4_9HYPH|nr:ester cyclase [Devosia nitrariae]GLQ55043.1 hypothetical protein GCM10010862_23020 [Devosia nitrariae]